MTDALHSDVAVTWLGAAGCIAYMRFLWAQRRGSTAAQAALFLFGVLSVLLLVRGLFWLSPPSIALGRLVFAAATLLPLAVTLFAEQLLRRHHPLGLKLTALAASVVFFAANLVFALPWHLPLLVAFLAALLVVLAWNGWLLVRQADADLSLTEAQLARAAAWAALFALPLVATDFREELGSVPVRLGALGPLILIHVMLRLRPGGNAALRAVLHLGGVLLGAAALSLAFGVVTVGVGRPLLAAWLAGLPVATAWVLVAAIVIEGRRLHAEAHSQNFLRWLLHARLDTVDGLLASLRRLPMTADHVALRAPDLAAYDLAKLFALAEARREPLSAAEARGWVASGHAGRLDAAEQLVDLLARHEMTHALLVAQQPPLVVLLNLPQGANAVTGEVRAGVIQRIARRIADREDPHAT